MRFILLLPLIFIFNSFVLAQGNILQISERIGNEIDSTTRVYFGLFSKVKNYKKAYLEKQNEQLRFVIECDSAGKSSVEYLNINQQLFDDYKYWINNFEMIAQPDYTDKHEYDSTFFKNCRVTGYYSNKNKKQINITLMDSSKITGQLLYANDNFLVLYLSNENYSWEIRKEYIKCIYYREILKIEEFNYDLIGGHHDLYLQNKPEFNSYISYVGNESSLPLLAPEIKQLIISSQKESQSKKYPEQIEILKISEYYKLKVEQKKTSEKSKDKFKLMLLGIGMGQIKLENNISCTMVMNFKPSQNYNITIPNVTTYFAEAIMNFDSLIDVGLTYQYLTDMVPIGLLLNQLTGNSLGINIYLLNLNGNLLNKESSLIWSLSLGYNLYFMNYSINWNDVFKKGELYYDYMKSLYKDLIFLNSVVYEYLLNSSFYFKVSKSLRASITAGLSYIPKFGKIHLELEQYNRTYKLDSESSNYTNLGYNIKLGIGIAF